MDINAVILSSNNIHDTYLQSIKRLADNNPSTTLNRNNICIISEDSIIILGMISINLTLIIEFSSLTTNPSTNKVMPVRTHFSLLIANEPFQKIKNVVEYG